MNSGYPQTDARRVVPRFSSWTVCHPGWKQRRTQHLTAGGVTGRLVLQVCGAASGSGAASGRQDVFVYEGLGSAVSAGARSVAPLGAFQVAFDRGDELVERRRVQRDRLQQLGV